MSKVLLVGESNPYGADPYYALYPAPDGCAGHRLCTLIMDLPRAQYVKRFDRVNLCAGEWSLKAARARMEELWQEAVELERPAIVLLGRKVAEAFRAPGVESPQPFTLEHNCTDTAIVSLPHPSGLCREWANPGAYERAREVLRRAGVL